MLAQDLTMIHLSPREQRLLENLTGQRFNRINRRELNQAVQDAIQSIHPDQPGACLARCLLEDFLQE